MNNFTIGSFYTKDTPYKKVAKMYLQNSFDRLKYDETAFECTTLDIVESRNYGSWYRNVAEKPKIILKMLKKLPKNKCLVFLDADATIERYPALFHEIPDCYDIAFHLLSWNQWYGYKKSPDTVELLTGTMFFRNNKKVHDLCEEWHENAVKTKEWEQKVLHNLFIAGKHQDIKIYYLPLGYCYMKSRPRGQEPLIKLSPVILHHQVSRELKKVIKN